MLVSVHAFSSTPSVRERDWTVAPLPQDLQDRRVEITGPVERKMIINALNSGASCFMADCEDSSAPTWENMVEADQPFDAVRHKIASTTQKKTSTTLNDEIATLIVQPQGWHLWERHIGVDGKPTPTASSISDCTHAPRAAGATFGPRLPDAESSKGAALEHVFLFSQKHIGIPKGTIRATVLIETLPAAFEMDEILYSCAVTQRPELAGGIIFNYIRIRNDDGRVVPDRSQVGMTRHMRSYSRLAIKTCHRRGVHAMGGMAAQIPIKNDVEANDAALAKVRADKLREVQDGHDGTWVAHPALVPIAKAIFDEHMTTPNQIEKQLEALVVTEDDLLKHPEGTLTEAGLRQNISVGIQYIESWLRGVGCVPLYNLMEDAATAEISRAQLWQWIKHEASLEDGRTVTPALFQSTLTEEMQKVSTTVGKERFETGMFSGPSRSLDLIYRERLRNSHPPQTISLRPLGNNSESLC